MLAKREPPSRGGKAAKGFGPTRTSDQSDSVSCGDGPREPGISFGSDRARRGRRDLFRQVRVGSKGHPSDSSRTPTRKATAGHQCPWPSSEARPSPCAGVAARPEDVIPSGVFERSDASGAFGIPPGSSEPWRNSTGSVGTSGLPCGPSGPSGGLEGTWEIFGFPRTRPVAFVPDLRVQTGLSTERLRPFRRRSLPSRRGPSAAGVRGRPAEPTGQGLRF